MRRWTSWRPAALWPGGGRRDEWRPVDLHPSGVWRAAGFGAGARRPTLFAGLSTDGQNCYSLDPLRPIGKNTNYLGDDNTEAVVPVVRWTRSVRLVFHGSVVVAFLLYFSTVSWAPNIGLADAAPSAPEPATPDPTRDPPVERDFGALPRPRLAAPATMVYNPTTHEILWASGGHQRRSIASITKVMTVLVFLTTEPDLTRDVVVSRRDVRRASTTYLRRGERIRLLDLLHLALVASDNSAARVLARVSPWGTERFVEQMNQMAMDLGLQSTVFADPSGLDKRNVSTAYDVARLIAYAADRPDVSTIMRKASYRLRTSRRGLTVRNTNRLVGGKLDVLSGKTGYIDASGYCLAALVDVPGAGPLSVVVLGAGSNSRRFSEVRRLVDWVSKHGESLLAPVALAD